MSDIVPSVIENPANNLILEQNYPNPFSGHTRIYFQFPKEEHVQLKIYNSIGQEVKTLVDKKRSAGRHYVDWDGSDKYGHKVINGIYFYQFRTSSFSIAKRMIVTR